MVNTKHVTGRRSLRFDHLADILADVETLAGQPHRSLGNWSLGQVVVHLAAFMEGSLDGFPRPMPCWMRWIARPMKHRLLNRPWPAGVSIPRRYRNNLTPAATTDENGLAELRRAVGRLDHESQRHPSPLLGELSREQWNQFHCRHAELHLSFIVPATG